MLRPITTLDGLAPLAGLDNQTLAALEPVVARYPLSVTPDMATLIAGGQAGIARQFVPDARELEQLDHERVDPIGDEAHSPLPGLVHRYRDRVLLKIVSACPVYCRFCFRREMVGPGGDGLTGAALDLALAYIAERPEITEVILTGGDPFMLSARRVRALMERLADIPNLELVRWHTRVPMVDPGRVDGGFVAALASARQMVWVAVHANHPAEFTAEAGAALARLRHAGIGLISQSVLLTGINDDVDTLADLMRAFLRHGVKPYYLHHPDLAPGTGHFRISIEQGQALVAALREQVTGLAQPTYVLDVPDAGFNAPLADGYVRQAGHGLEVRGAGGQWYPHHDT